MQETHTDIGEGGEEALLQARRFLRGNTTGIICFAEHVRPTFYTLDPAGHPVCPVSAAMVLAGDTVLRVPDEAQDAMSILVTIEDLAMDSAEGDRWRIYHGDPEETFFARLYLEAAKYHGLVIDGEALAEPNLLADAEPALCRQLNAGPREALVRIARRGAGVEVVNPVVVGVDHYGVHVRAAFGIVRVEFAQVATDAEAARQMIEQLAGPA